MTVTEIFLGASFCAYPVLIGWGWVMVDRSNHASAKLLFWIGPLTIGVSEIMWGFNAETPLVGRVITSFIFGGILLTGLTESLRWVANEVSAQTHNQTQVSADSEVTVSDNAKSKPSDVVGAVIVGNGQGGVAADIAVTGTSGQMAPVVGMDIHATGAPGQSVTGLKIIQNGPGTGLRVTVGGNGPAVGVRSTVTSGTPGQ